MLTAFRSMEQQYPPELHVYMMEPIALLSASYSLKHTPVGTPETTVTSPSQFCCSYCWRYIHLHG
jgi:hypothetical protein